MRILHITSQAPDTKSGGELGVYQTIKSLYLNDYDIDYVGPEIKKREISLFYRNLYYLSPDRNKIRRCLRLLQGITNSRYNAWRKLQLDCEKYDVVVLDFTKLDYIVKNNKIKKLIVKVHNVEYDYARNDYAKNGGITRKIIALMSKKQERAILDRADAILTLTENDKNRLKELYGEQLEKKIVINPVAVEKKVNEGKKSKGFISLLITGSLWYGDNVDGAVWFIENVFSKLNFNARLVIAGSNPNEKIKRVVSKFSNIELYDSPDSMAPFFETCDVVIAPVFEGAGMKVKVAEALSYSKIVVGTRHAFIGYDVIDCDNAFIADSEEEFIRALNSIYSFTDNQWTEKQKRIEKLFLSKYSIASSAKVWQKTVEIVSKEDIGYQEQKDNVKRKWSD